MNLHTLPPYPLSPLPGPPLFFSPCPIECSLGQHHSASLCRHVPPGFRSMVMNTSSKAAWCLFSSAFSGIHAYQVLPPFFQAKLRLRFCTSSPAPADASLKHERSSAQLFSALVATSNLHARGRDPEDGRTTSLQLSWPSSSKRSRNES